MIEKILNASKTKGLKQEALERMCGLAEDRISKWKNNQGEPTARQILRIADTLGLPVRYLIDDAMEEPTPDIDEARRRILWLAETIGLDEAVRRLTAAPQTTTAPRHAGPYTVDVEIPERPPKPSSRKSG